MIYAIVSALVLILDQAVKLWTTKNIVPMAIGDECVELIPGVLHMTNVQNTGAAFSILANARWLLVAVSLVFIIGIIVLISSEIISTKFGRWTAVLVMAGALGNCIDRVFYGYVVDMFEIELFNFAVFNIADIFITVCGILFCIHVILYREPAEVAAAVPKKARPAKAGRTAASRTARADKAAQAAPAPRRTHPSRSSREDPYADIPRRGEHHPLADELKPKDPEDPFAEWEFGQQVDDEEPEQPAPAPRSARQQTSPRPAAPSRQQAPARRTAPARKPVPAEPEDDWGELDLPEPAPRKAAPRAAARTSAPKAAPKEAASPRPAVKSAPWAPEPAPEAPREEDEAEYSLEDILAEFRDL